MTEELLTIGEEVWCFLSYGDTKVLDLEDFYLSKCEIVGVVALPGTVSQYLLRDFDSDEGQNDLIYKSYRHELYLSKEEAVAELMERVES